MDTNTQTEEHSVRDLSIATIGHLLSLYKDVDLVINKIRFAQQSIYKMKARQMQSSNKYAIKEMASSARYVSGQMDKNIDLCLESISWLIQQKPDLKEAESKLPPECRNSFALYVMMTLLESGQATNITAAKNIYLEQLPLTKRDSSVYQAIQVAVKETTDRDSVMDSLDDLRRLMLEYKESVK